MAKKNGNSVVNLGNASTDFYMKVKQTNGSYKKFIIEVKPKAQCKQPNKNPLLIEG